MKSITREQRNQAFENASPIQQSLYADGESGAKLMAIAETFGLVDSEIYTKFSLTVGDFVLGFYSQTELNIILSQALPVPTTKIPDLVFEIEKFLAPINKVRAEETSSGHSETYADTIAAGTDTSSPPYVRTMSYDIAAVQHGEEAVHRSSQDALLAEQVELADALARVSDRPLPTPPPTLIHQPPLAPTNNPAQPSAPTSIPIKRAADMPRWDSES